MQSQTCELNEFNYQFSTNFVVDKLIYNATFLSNPLKILFGLSSRQTRTDTVIYNY